MPKKISANGRAVLSRYETHLESRTDIRSATADTYLTLLRAFVLWHETTLRSSFVPDQITTTDLIAYRQFLVRQKLRPATINRVMSSLRSYFGWALNAGFIQVSPINGLSALPLLTSGMTASRAEAEDIRGCLEKGLGTRDSALTAMILLAGLKTQHASTIRRQDISLKQRTMRLPATDWDIPLDKALIRLSTDYLSMLDTSDYVFPSRKGQAITSRTVEYIVARVAEKAGIARPITPTALRRRFITDLRHKNAPAAVIDRLLGRSQGGAVREPSTEELAQWLPSRQ